MPRMDSPRRSPACGKFAALVSIEFGASGMLASQKKTARSGAHDIMDLLLDQGAPRLALGKAPRIEICRTSRRRGQMRTEMHKRSKPRNVYCFVLFDRAGRFPSCEDRTQVSRLGFVWPWLASISIV